MTDKESKTLGTIRGICPCCMENHVFYRVQKKTSTVMFGKSVEYTGEYYYCGNTEVFFADEEQLTANYKAAKAVLSEQGGMTE